MLQFWGQALRPSVGTIKWLSTSDALSAASQPEHSPSHFLTALILNPALARTAFQHAVNATLSSQEGPPMEERAVVSVCGSLTETQASCVRGGC